ncbi:MAG: polymorphic toxin type 44 domain-containing protein [Anaerolineales bacterium]
MTTYQYDIANRLAYVNAQAYTWDNNGNLLNDGTGTYTYNHANRLASASISGEPYTTFRYNGLGDRLEQTIDMHWSRYTLDLAGGLTQVLSNGTNQYLYGDGRIGEEKFTDWQYYLSDGLGSVRQLTDNTGAVTMAKGYEPYGEVLNSSGGASTSYGYTNEYTSQGLIYLRARYYNPSIARFMTRDTWGGDKKEPMSYNGWLYVYANPVNLTDPSGMFPSGGGSGNEVARFIIQRMQEDSNSEIGKIIYQLNTTKYYINACNAYRQMPWWLKIAIGGPRYLAYAEYADIAARNEASLLFGCRVADARSRPICGQWDYKKDIRDIWGEAQTVDFSDIGIEEDVIFYYDIWANFHFGYVGSSLGFSEQALLTGAAIEHAASNLEIKIQDDPSDVVANLIGIYMFRNHNLSERALLSWIYIERNELNKAEVDANGNIIRIYR